MIFTPFGIVDNLIYTPYQVWYFTELDAHVVHHRGATIDRDATRHESASKPDPVISSQVSATRSALNL
ncbi:hypothetical protein AB0L82_35690 [Nocardia sp. NPDC052001]|uniref:hypothetical protein n=1 Tax=Nocardia sp. NPDC052001 TaxID=3154853 RepID=UPI003439EFA4